MNIIEIAISIIIGIAVGWIGSDIHDNFKPPKIIKQEIITTIETIVTSKNEMNNYQVQSTVLYQGLSNQQLYMSFTNQIGYTNYQKNIITNSNSIKIITNNI